MIRLFITTLVVVLTLMSVFAEPYKMANIVCFVKFADEADKAWEHDFDYYDNMFNSTEEGANSVRNFFSDMSYGSMDWESTILPFEYVDSHPVGYFLPKGNSNPDGYTDLDLMLDTRIKTLVKDMCLFLDEKLASYDFNGDGFIDENDKIVVDANGDGEVDNIVMIICGDSDKSASRMLWPSNNRGATAYLGGVKVGNYLKVFDGANGYKSMVPQKINTGVLCHEMTHTLGAYDLYTTKGNANSTLEPVNVWDLMSDNQTVPQGLTAYMRMQYGSPFGGWLPRTDIKQISQNGRYTLRPLSSETPDDVAFIIRPDRTRAEYFMVEYRDRNDMWDSSLPAGGMLVYRVNPLVTQTGNLGKDFELYVFRPNSNAGTSAGLIKRATLGTDTRRTSFGHIDDNDYPFYSDGTRAYFCITDVKETAEGISFSFSTDITGSSAVTEIDADLIPDGKIYTLQGIRINRITSTGIYIIDGKKVFVRK